MSKSFYEMVSILVGVVGIPLTMTNKKVSGTIGMTFNSPVQVPIKLNPRVVKSFVGGGLGILVHVSGDLYIIAYCLAVNGVVSVYVIDGKGKGADYLSGIVDASGSLREIVDSIRPSIAASYYWSGASWTVLKLPK